MFEATTLCFEPQVHGEVLKLIIGSSQTRVQITGNEIKYVTGSTFSQGIPQEPKSILLTLTRN